MSSAASSTRWVPDAPQGQATGASRRDDGDAERCARDVARYRLIFDSIEQGFCTIEVLFDEAGRPVDYVFLETNRAFVEQTGLVGAVGRRMRELAPAHEDYWFEIYGRIVRSGIAERFEAPAGAIGRWYEVHAFRIDAPEQHHVAVLFADIGPRKRSEAALAAAAARDAFLVALSDALRPLADPGELLAQACRVIAEHLGTDRAFYAVVSHDARHCLIEGGHHAPGVAPLQGRYAFDGFGPLLMNEMRRGRTLVVTDVAAEPALTEDEKASFAALDIGACVGVPLVKGGRWVALLSVHQRERRPWTADELALIEDTAERTWAAVERARAEAALLASEERTRLALDVAGMGAYVWYVQEDRGEPDARTFALLGLAPGSRVSLRGLLAERVHPADRARLAAAVERAVDPAGSGRLQEELRILPPEGGERWLSITGRSYFAGEPPRALRMAGVVADVSARREAEVALHASEQRFRLIVETARDYAIFTCDEDGVIVDWLPGAQAVFGWSGAEAIGRPIALTFTPEDRAGGVPEQELDGARRHGTASDRRWHLRRDGRRVFIDGVTTALKDEAGAVLGFVKIGQDVTERHAAEDALRESEQRFREFASATSDVLWVRDARSMRLEFASPAFAQVYGVAAEHLLPGDDLRHWARLIHPEDRAAVLEALGHVRTGERVTHEFRIVRPSDGELRWLRSTDFPLVGRGERVERIGGIGHDISDEKQASNRLEVLVGELQHRTRNLMAVVRSIAARTARESGTLAEFRERFDGRLESLALVQNLLSRLSEGRKVAFDELLRAELAAHAAPAERVLLEGPPDVRLRSSSVQTFAMALHELATNSLKYGALAAPTGRLEVRWHVEAGDERAPRQLHVHWAETGGRLRDAAGPPPGGGFGRELIERALPYQLKARTRYEIGPEGVRCAIVVPIAPAGDVAD